MCVCVCIGGYTSPTSVSVMSFSVNRRKQETYTSNCLDRLCIHTLLAPTYHGILVPGEMNVCFEMDVQTMYVCMFDVYIYTSIYPVLVCVYYVVVIQSFCSVFVCIPSSVL